MIMPRSYRLGYWPTKKPFIHFSCNRPITQNFVVDIIVQRRLICLYSVQPLPERYLLRWLCQWKTTILLLSIPLIFVDYGLPTKLVLCPFGLIPCIHLLAF